MMSVNKALLRPYEGAVSSSLKPAVEGKLKGTFVIIQFILVGVESGLGGLSLQCSLSITS